MAKNGFSLALSQQKAKKENKNLRILRNSHTFALVQWNESFSKERFSFLI